MRVTPRSSSSGVCSNRATAAVASVARLQRRHRGVQAAEHLDRAGVAVGGDAAEQAAQLAHRGGRLGVVADDVADDQHRGAAGLQERVVPVAADPGRLGRGQVAHRDLAVVGLRRLGEQAALQPLGQLLLGAVEPGVVQRQPRPVGDVLRGREVLVVGGVPGRA